MKISSHMSKNDLGFRALLGCVSDLHGKPVQITDDAQEKQEVANEKQRPHDADHHQAQLFIAPRAKENIFHGRQAIAEQ